MYFILYFLFINRLAVYKAAQHKSAIKAGNKNVLRSAFFKTASLKKRRQYFVVRKNLRELFLTDIAVNIILNQI